MGKNRVHGEVKICRSNFSIDKKYSEGKQQLVKDFNGMCGYCGKIRKVFLDDFQIDHFAPKSKFPQRENDYLNLVLSCSQCNNLKSNKWVTNDAYESNNGKIGFCDPVLDEFDEHLSRDENGSIICRTSIGKYMYDVFKFNIRPTSVIFKINKLEELKKILENDETNFGLRKYREVNITLEKLLQYVKYENRE